MNKEEILAKSRAENKEGDEREKNIRKTSAIPAFIAAGVVGVILMTLEFIFLDTTIVLYSVFLMITSMACVQNWYLLIVLKKKHLLATALCSTFTVVIAILMVIDAFQEMM